jgi:hypothetical protein
MPPISALLSNEAHAANTGPFLSGAAALVSQPPVFLIRDVSRQRIFQ